MVNIPLAQYGAETVPDPVYNAPCKIGGLKNAYIGIFGQVIF